MCENNFRVLFISRENFQRGKRKISEKSARKRAENLHTKVRSWKNEKRELSSACLARSTFICQFDFESRIRTFESFVSEEIFHFQTYKKMDDLIESEKTWKCLFLDEKGKFSHKEKRFEEVSSEKFEEKLARKIILLWNFGTEKVVGNILKE